MDNIKSAAQKFIAIQYAKAPEQSVDDATYVQSVSENSFIAGAKSNEAKEYWFAQFTPINKGEEYEEGVTQIHLCGNEGGDGATMLVIHKISGELFIEVYLRDELAHILPQYQFTLGSGEANKMKSFLQSLPSNVKEDECEKKIAEMRAAWVMDIQSHLDVIRGLGETNDELRE